jgi:multidrug efflux pump subunit AcrA (membrane-fusion protein)
MIWQRVQNELGRHAVTLREAVSDNDARARMRRLLNRPNPKKLIVAGAIAAGLIAAVAYTRPAPAVQNSTVATPLPAVVVVPVRLTRLAPQIALAGTVVSRNDSHLAADVEGRVAWVAEVGVVVSTGDVVARLDDSVAATQLASDKANVGRLAAQLRYDRAQADRMQNLFAQNAISKSAREQATSTRDVDAEALAQAQAALSKSQYQYDHDNIRAPFAGRVVARLVNPGE